MVPPRPFQENRMGKLMKQKPACFPAGKKTQAADNRSERLFQSTRPETIVICPVGVFFHFLVSIRFSRSVFSSSSPSPPLDRFPLWGYTWPNFIEGLEAENSFPKPLQSEPAHGARPARGRKEGRCRAIRPKPVRRIGFPPLPGLRWALPEASIEVVPRMQVCLFVFEGSRRTLFFSGRARSNAKELKHP